MKDLITLLFVVMVFNTNAQEKKLLKNQVNNIELNQSREVFRKKNAKLRYQSQEAQQRRGTKRQSQTRAKRRETINFDYFENYANSEINVRIPEYGYFGVEIESQYIDTYTGEYRFFDIKEGINWVSVYKDGYLIYKTPLKIFVNTRVVLEFDSITGLFLISERPLKRLRDRRNYNPKIDIHIPEPSYPKCSPGYVDNYESNAMKNPEFIAFKRYLNTNCNFDNDKIEYIRLAKNCCFTTLQIRELINLMFQDSKKITAVKLSYPNCIDKKMYYTLLDCFTFPSQKRKLRKFIENQEN